VAFPAEDKAKYTFSTEGIPELGGSNFMTRGLMRVVAWVERLNFRFSKVGNRAVFDNSVFPWTQEIEREWTVIRAELNNVLIRRHELPPFQEILPEVGTITSDSAWKVFVLGGFGSTSERNIAQCPHTWRVVRRIPGFVSAIFSVFEPGKHLPPHRGAYNGVLRLHLGLIVPPDRQKLALRVEDTICHWEEGKVLIFDDAYEHEAWNHSDQTRVVLLVDFIKPLRFPANLMNWLLLKIAVFTPFIREGMENQKEWEKRFYASN
jgi:ornithine lipid ester-linked acyl 2-hydroxylase